MATYSIRIEGELKARNLRSAQGKLSTVQDKLAKAGVQTAEVHMKGEK
jgi:hypothetical protein